jgi:SAM-dependent methyltransferase
MNIIIKLKKFIKYKYKYYFLNNIYKNSSITESNGLTIRKYNGEKSYQNYLMHQKFKFDFYKKPLDDNFEDQTNIFFDNFKNIKTKYKDKKYTLCLGARTGAEVNAFRKLNFFSIGIDINYPKNSPYVVFGDFHNLQFPNESFDIVYSNCIDHTYDLNKFVNEAKRVCKKDGLIIFDLQKGKQDDERYNFGNFEALGWTNTDIIIKKICENDLSVVSKENISKDYFQVVLKL